MDVLVTKHFDEMTYLFSSWIFPLFVSWLDPEEQWSALPICDCRGPCILSKTSFHTLTPAQIFVQYKIAWHSAPVSRWKNDFMYMGQPCDFVVIWFCFCVETPFSFFVFLFPLQKKTKANPPQIHRMNTTHLTQWLQLRLTSQQITSHTVFLMPFQILPFSSSTPGNLYSSSLQVLNWFL